MSVTTVPIHPIKKGSLQKYWIGIALVVLAAAGLAYWGTQPIRGKYQSNDAFLAKNNSAAGVVTTASGLQIKTLRGGEGASPTDEDVVLIKYKGTLRDGTVFDENPQAAMPVAGVVPGFSEALKKMQRGGHYTVWIPGKLGYGPNPPSNPQTGQPALPADALLIFDVELLEFKSRAEVEAMQKKLQEMQKKQGGGAPAGGPPAVGQAGGQPNGAPQGLPPEIQAQIDQQMQAQGQMPGR
jgi:FKBP-type peptidyl-prolyl cis-trans isomerase FkpA